MRAVVNNGRPEVIDLQPQRKRANHSQRDQGQRCQVAPACRRSGTQKRSRLPRRSGHMFVFDRVCWRVYQMGTSVPSYCAHNIATTPIGLPSRHPNVAVWISVCRARRWNAGKSRRAGECSRSVSGTPKHLTGPKEADAEGDRATRNGQ